MKNVITLLIDSVYSETLSTKKTQISSTPFIDTLLGKSVFAPNVYSYGPYTDAASKALYCGNRTLDDFGYFFGLVSSQYNHFRIFKENGYETYGLYYPYYLLPSEIEKDIDYSLYTSGFKYTSVWGGKFVYYADQKKNRELTQQEYNLLTECMRMVFDCWSIFYKNLESQQGSAEIVSGTYNPKICSTDKQGLEAEIEKFTADPIGYMNCVLEMGMQHPLAKINGYDYGREEDFAFVREIYSKNDAFFKKLSRVNAARNLVNNPLSIKKSFKSVYDYFKTRDKTEFRYFGNYGMLLSHTELMKKRSLSPKWQDLASLNKQIDVLLDNLDKRENGKPFYASLHALEPHHNISFFSFDSFNQELIKEELDYIEPLIDGCGKKFRGNLIYQASLRYVDLCIKRLFEKLSERGLLENTVVMLVSDHGTSYTFDPVRTRVVNTFHKENYNIPMLIWDNDMPKELAGEYDGTFCSDDVYPTLCDIVGINLPELFTGSSIIKNPDGREYVITEYMGPGVPDMIEREVWISIRNEKYVIAYKNPINKELDINNPFCIYDLAVDPYELKNVANSLTGNEEIAEMKRVVNERYEEIRDKAKEYLEKF